MWSSLKINPQAAQHEDGRFSSLSQYQRIWEEAPTSGNSTSQLQLRKRNIPPNDLKDERPKLPKIVPQKWGLYIYIYGYWIAHVYIYRPTKLTGNIYIYTYVWHPLHPIYTYIKYIYGIHAENATLPFWGQYAFFQWEVLILETKSQYLSEARGVSMTNFFWVETLVKSKWSFFPQQQ